MNTKATTTIYYTDDSTLMERMISALDRMQGRMPLALGDDRLPGVIRLSPTICGTHVCAILHDTPDWEFQDTNWEVISEL